DQLLQRVHQWQLDLELVARLEEIQMRESVIKDRRFDAAVLDRQYADEFRKYGIDVDQLTPQDAAGRIRTSQVRNSLLAALDDWALHRRQSALNWRLLVAVACAADAHKL